MDISRSMRNTPPRPARLSAAWRALVEPPASILAPAARRRARLLSGLTLCALVVYVPGSLGYAAAVRGFRLLPGDLLAYGLLLAIYLTSRTRFTAAALAALLAAFPLEILSGILDGSAPNAAATLAFLSPAFVLAGIFLDETWTAVYGYGLSLLMLLLPVAAPQAVPGVGSVLAPFAAGLTTVTLCLTAIRQRRRLEDERRAALQRDHDHTLSGWSQMVELQDRETHGHARRVTEMTLRLARACGLREPELEYVYQGAMLHDIGKMAIPDEILFKDTLLTDEEWEVMRTHPRVAYDMLSSISFLEKALVIPAYHHECWDGGGYPFGLRGDDIPLPARVFAVVDAWDALLSDRPYRKAWTKEGALQYIKDQAGRRFDPEIVERFLALGDF